MTIILFVLVFSACIFATRYVAKSKRRDQTYWTVVAVLLGPLALVAVALLPSK
jgi:uncharacterized membrane protein YoaK (UPF0700 family)